MIAAMHSWRAVIFDFDGVLCDSKALAIAEAERLRSNLTYHGLPSPRARGDFGELYRGVLRDSLLRFGIDKGQSREFFDAHAHAMAQRFEELDLFEGVADQIDSFDPRSFAIVTSSHSHAVRKTFARSGIHLGVDSVVGHEVRQTKTQKIGSVLARMGIAADEAVYVGDMESDVLYCRDVPLRCIAVTYGYHPPHVLSEALPFRLVDSPRLLFSLLRQGFFYEGSTPD